jgi:hypothetical protein
MIERKNILFGKLLLKDSKKLIELDNCVFTEGDLQYKNKDIIKVISFKNIGKTSINTNYTEVKKSNEQRNKITGAYE